MYIFYLFVFVAKISYSDLHSLQLPVEVMVIVIIIVIVIVVVIIVSCKGNNRSVSKSDVWPNSTFINIRKRETHDFHIRKVM